MLNEMACKYYKQKRQVSYDEGVTWIDVTPAEYQKGELYEYDSPDCKDYSKEYLTFIPTTGSSTFTFNGVSANTVSYSLDSGATWVSLASSAASPSVSAGQKIMWKGNCIPISSYPYGIGSFTSTNKFDVEGNAMSLLYGDNFENQTDLTGKNNAFYYLFINNTNVVNAKYLSLPATILSDNCYYQMFYRCTSLVTAPQLPATTLAINCYYDMFAGSSITTAPELPATTLTGGCYNCMFSGCTSLTSAPQLPATTLADYCYANMFNGCTSLTTAPALPATTIASNCYANMFQGCTSLTTAPQLPATTLANSCYSGMFAGCRGLTTAPQLPATALTINCYKSMFTFCESLITPPELPATTLASACYEQMFMGCSIRTAPALPATTLEGHCYEQMFTACDHLTKSPVLSATTLVGYCYAEMFLDCSDLEEITCLATDKSATGCTKDWVKNVYNSEKCIFYKNSSANWSRGDSAVPSNWLIYNY